MKRKFAIIGLTVLLFLCATLLGIATVFRVNSVTLSTDVSKEMQADVRALQTELLELYKNKSVFTVKEKNAKSLLEKYPYLRITEFKKAYPNKLLVSIVEEEEVYELLLEDGSGYILSRDGVVMKECAVTDTAKVGLVQIKGVHVTGKEGGLLIGDKSLETMLALCKGLDKCLTGIGRNVLSVEVWRESPDVFYLVQMSEGVKIYVNNPAELPEEKAAKAIESYLALQDREKMCGRLIVGSRGNEVFADYRQQDDFYE